MHGECENWEQRQSAPSPPPPSYHPHIFSTTRIFASSEKSAAELAKPKPAQKEKANLRCFLHRITWVCTLGGFLFGYDTGVINGALPFMRRDFGLTDVTVGIVASSLLIGAAIGAFLSGKFADRFGRRRTLIVLSVLFIIGTIGSALAPSLYVLLPFRCILGLAVGGASATVPVLLAELSPANRRGQVVTRNELMIVTGQLVAFMVNAILGTHWSHHDGIWRWMLMLAVLPAIGLLVGVLCVGMPESPRWLASEEHYEQAFEVLKKIRVSEMEALIELEEMRKTAEEDQQATFRDVLAERWLRRCLLIGVGVAMCNQLAGVNSIMYYGTEILTGVGFGTEAALIANIGNGVISVLATGLGIWMLGLIGRRPLLMTGQIGAIVAHLLIGICSLTLPANLRGPLILCLIVTFLLFQQGGISPVTWLMQSEMFPLRVRGLAMGLSTFVHWLVNFSIGLSFPILMGAIGISATFFLFAAIGVLAVFFVWRWMPETRGKTLEELERQFHDEQLAELRRPGIDRILGDGGWSGRGGKQMTMENGNGDERRSGDIREKR